MRLTRSRPAAPLGAAGRGAFGGMRAWGSGGRAEGGGCRDWGGGDWDKAHWI